MDSLHIAITIGVVVLATVLDRFLPYIAFPSGKPIPSYVQYLGRVLGPAVFGLLVVYCLRNVSLTAWPYGIPEAIALLVVWASYLWKRNMMVSMAVGTVVYMVLVQTVFAAV